jgi:hypothetical protein
VLLACANSTVDRAEWQAMSREDRLLYVHSLIGEQRARNAKGGTGRPITRSPEAYMAAIDAAYARGDQRPVAEVFAGL